MAHYTGHTFTLTELNTIEQQKSDFLDSLNIKLSSPDLLVKDMALMLKSLEVMENLEHLPEYKDFIINVAKRSAQFVSPLELVENGGFDVVYNTSNLVQNSSFSSDAFEIELVKNSGFDVPVDRARPWANGIAYLFDVFVTEGTEIISAYSDGQQTAVAWFETQLKPNTQYKFSYDLVVNDVNWGLPTGGFNLVDVKSSDEMAFSEAGGGPDPKTIVISIIEDENLVLPTCNGIVVEWDNTVDYNLALVEMENTCVADDSVWNYHPLSSSFYCDTGTGYPGDGSVDQAACYANNATWFSGELTNPNTQEHLIVPYHVEAREGDTLIFTNPVGNYLVHNAVSDDNISFTSPDMNPGDTWNWVVDGYHDIYFHCTFHPLEEGRMTTKTNHRYVYSINHGLNPGDTVKMAINYGSMVELPSLSNSYFINLLLPNTMSTIGGAPYSAVESLYHDLSIGQIVTMQSGTVETNPDADVPIVVSFIGGIESDTLGAGADATVVAGAVDSITLTYAGENYSSKPAMYITGGGGSGATGTLEFNGLLSTINLTEIGSGYLSAPTIVISAPDVAQFGPDSSCSDPTFTNQSTCETNAETWYDAITTSQATATCTITPEGEIDTITITNQGSGYHASPTISFLGGTPTVSAVAESEIDGSIYTITLVNGGSGYGSGDGSVGVGERNWEEYIVNGVAKGDERIDVFFNDINAIGHTHTAVITPAQYVQIKSSVATLIQTSDTDGHTHTATFDWDAAANNGAGAMFLVGMTGTHTHGMEEYFEISGGTKVELVNFGHYHEILISEDDEATLKASPVLNTTQDLDGTWSHDGTGTTIIRTSDFGTSDPQHFHTVEFGCLDPSTDTYLIMEIDQHIHDFGRVWYPGSNQFTVSQYDFALGGDDLNPSSIATSFTDISGYVKKEKGIESDAHGLHPGDRVHYTNVYNGVHHGNTNYFVDYIIDADHLVLTEVLIYPLQNAVGTTPTTHNVIESYEVVADLASYRFQVERDITNHIGSPYVSGIQYEWSRPTTVKSDNHGLSVGDVVQLPSGEQLYTPSELPGAMNDHTVVALGDGYGPTDNMEITVDTNTSITWADPNVTTVEGAQDSPWLWSWWDHTAEVYSPYQLAGATHDNFGGNDGTNGGFNLYRGGTYKFINNAWHPLGHITLIDPVTGVPQPMYMHAAGIKGIRGAGWDNLVQSGMSHVAGLSDSGEHRHCISMRATFDKAEIPAPQIGDYNDFVNTEEEPGTWVGIEDFPTCTALNGWCESLDVSGWFYNGGDVEADCLALNPTEDPGLPQWRGPQWVGNFAKEFTWRIPEDFGLTGSDGQSGLGPFVPPGEVNGAYHVTHDGGLYRFDKSGMIEGTNRTINLYRGGTYRFKINSAGHPIYVTTDDGSHFTPGSYFGEYLLGVQNSRAEEGAGNQLEGVDMWSLDDSGVEKFETLTWTVPEVAPDTMYYQCAWHASMMGTFNILDMPVTNAGDDVVVFFHHGQDNMYTPLHIRDKILVDNGTSDDYFQVQPVPANSFPVKGTQDDLLGTNNQLTATGPGATPKIQAMNIELGTVSYIDPLAMIPGIGSEQFLVTNNVGGLAKVYFSLDIGERSDITLDNVLFKEVVWTETGDWSVSGGVAFTTSTNAAYIEQIVTGTINDGVTYEVQYDIIESFKDQYGAEIGSITAELRGDTVVQGTANTLVGHYTETLTAPVNTDILRLVNSGKGKIDNVSIKERVTGQNAWSMGEGWTSNGAKAYLDGSISSSTEISQSVAIDTGKLYEVKYLLNDVDPNNNGMTGRMRVALGTNPNQLISNSEFDINDPLLVNWVNSDASVQIIGEQLVFNSSSDGTSTFTLANALVNKTNYEITVDCELLEDNILNFQVGPGPTGTHLHTFQMTSTQAEWLQDSPGINSLTFIQTDGYHAGTYVHEFTIQYSSGEGYRISEQTNPEGHDELTLVSTTINTPVVEVVINGVTVGTINKSGIHHIDFIGSDTNTIVLKMNGSGAINSTKLIEEGIAVIDYNTSGLNQDGEKVYHVRAGGHDQKIHMIGEPDNNIPESNNPYYSNVGFEGSIDNVSVREITEQWTFASQQDGKSYVDQNSQQIYTSGTGENNRGIAYITFEMELGMSYKVSVKVDRPTDSILKLGPTPDSTDYGTLVIEDSATSGVFDEQREFIFKSSIAGTCYLTLSTIGNGFTRWDDVSVKTIPNLSSDEYLLLARSMNVMGVPIGGEERWDANHLDSKNMDYTGQPIAGMRTMESYGESIIEDYYDVNRRVNEIYNPPIALTSIDFTTGYRSVSAIVPSCTTNFGTEEYTIETACEFVVGTWNPTVDAHCSNTDFLTEGDCLLDFGLWTVATLGYCSDVGLTSEYSCGAAGTCSDPTYSFEYTCSAAGTCTDPVYNNNEVACLDSGGTCSDPSFLTSGTCYESLGTCTDGISETLTACENAGGTWTATNTWTAVNTYTNANNTWTSAGNTWTPGIPGFCSDGIQTTIESCEGPRGTWILEEFEHCNTDIVDLTLDNQVDCESPRGTWDTTVVESMEGQWVEILGDGIDFDHTVTLGGVEQTNQVSINLPYKIKFEVAADTPLGDQILTVTNSDGDSATLTEQLFTVTDQLRIINVSGSGSAWSITGAGFEFGLGNEATIEFITSGTTTIEYTELALPQTTTLINVVGAVLVSGTYDVRISHGIHEFTKSNAITIP